MTIIDFVIRAMFIVQLIKSETEMEVIMADKAEELKRKPNQKPFHRDGAKYVCSVCKKKYFTQAEVVKCFESHPVEPEAMV